MHVSVVWISRPLSGGFIDSKNRNADCYRCWIHLMAPCEFSFIFTHYQSPAPLLLLFLTSANPPPLLSSLAIHIGVLNVTVPALHCFSPPPWDLAAHSQILQIHSLPLLPSGVKAGVCEGGPSGHLTVSAMIFWILNEIFNADKFIRQDMCFGFAPARNKSGIIHSFLCPWTGFYYCI